MDKDSGAPRRAVDLRWKKIIALGEGLFSLGITEEKKSLPPDELAERQRERIEEAAAELFQAQAEVWIAEHPLETLQTVGIRGDEDLTELMRSALESLGVCLSQEAESEQIWLAEGGGRPEKITRMASPLLVLNEEQHKKQIIGAVQVSREHGEPFQETDVDLFSAFASQTAIAVAAGRHIHLELWRQQQLGLVQQVSAQIASLRDLDELCKQVTEQIFKTFGYYYVAIFTLEAERDVLHFRASAGPLSQEGETQLQPLPLASGLALGEGMIGHVAESGEELLAADVSQEPHFRHEDSLPETRSEAAIPLKVESRVLGVLDVQSDHLDGFDTIDLTVLRTLAGNIAIAVEGAQLYTALNKRASQLSTLYEVSQAITSILNLEQLLESVVQLIQERFGYPFVHLFSVHYGFNKVIYEAGSGPRSQQSKEVGLHYDLDDPLGIIPWVARRGETVLANDVNDEPRYRPSPLPPVNTQSELAVPLIFGDEILGVLDIQSDELNAFTEEERFLFESLADHIAIALRNANLYRSEVWRRKVTDSLREVAGLLSAEMNLDHLLQTILQELERTLPLELSAIWLLEGDDPAELQLAAYAGPAASSLELDTTLSPEDVLECNPPVVHPVDHAEAVRWLYQALESSVPVIRQPDSSYEPLGAALDFPQEYSAIAAPLRVGDRPLGLLTLSHHTPGRYGKEAQAMTSAFASYASIAIENTRLYESAHEQAWVSTVLLQVANAVHASDNMQDLLDTIVNIMPTLVDVQACLCYLLDEDGYFVPRTSWGLDKNQRKEFERWRYAPSEVNALQKLVDEKFPVILDGLGEDASLANVLYSLEEFEAGEPHLQFLVPLLFRDEVLGAFLLDYGTVAQVASQDVETLFEERLAIIQGIAQQTAMAMENIRLLRAQQEEAYVTIALLQVAQAIVSANTLEDMLSSTIRTIPILVGVQRAAIFLCDDSYQEFLLGQVYGLPPEIEGTRIPFQNFPFLKRAVEENHLVAFRSQTSAEEQALKAWVGVKDNEFIQDEKTLLDELRLTMAFPLAVKGDVLGVLVVEEPETHFEAEQAVSQSNRRLRPRRIEITRGISQQIAVAIQNDRLQRQMVEQERLEREMQLAREIQQAFLPHEVPTIPGWDLKVLWQTAREVGGDFYDYFKLPNGRLGLVIADVADKGMPAALFMTLVRTLLRATVQVLDSPDAVLERINNIILPDAPKGMFVTLVYAVLDLESGHVEMVNAGHNPPLIWLHEKKKLQAIPKSGMALGVQENVTFQTHHLDLEPGDFLVFYTDGVTEAFSEAEEIFGEARLLSLVEKALEQSTGQTDESMTRAHQLVDVIYQEVKSFVGDHQPSDDLTLLVLGRED